MWERYMKPFLLSALIMLMLASCSNEQESSEDKGIIKKATDKVAHEIVEKIQRPMDKARAVKSLEEQRAARLKEQTEMQ